MKTLNVIGLMSGTSLDGIDAALVEISPDMSCRFLDGISIEYSKEMQSRLKKLFESAISPKFLCEMNTIIGEYFAKAAIALEEKFGKKADLIGSHGITFYHNPSNEKFEDISLNSTMQIGDGAVIAERTGITTVCDFRPNDMAHGGQGAPLVPFADKIFFFNENIPRAILNLGGIANVTVLSKNCDIIAFDTGPANMLIDLATKKLFNLPFDKDGAIARSGKINSSLLEYLMSVPYLKQVPPKSTGRELFGENFLNEILLKYDDAPENIIATLSAYTAMSIKDAFSKFIYPKTDISEIVVGGGGAYNNHVIGLLKKEFEPNVSIKTHEDFGISNKYKEAMAFAILAYCSYYNIPNNVKTATGAVKDVVLGKIIRKDC